MQWNIWPIVSMEDGLTERVNGNRSSLSNESFSFAFYILLWRLFFVFIRLWDWRRPKEVAQIFRFIAPQWKYYSATLSALIFRLLTATDRIRRSFIGGVSEFGVDWMGAGGVNSPTYLAMGNRFDRKVNCHYSINIVCTMYIDVVVGGFFFTRSSDRLTTVHDDWVLSPANMQMRRGIFSYLLSSWNASTEIIRRHEINTRSYCDNRAELKIPMNNAPLPVLKHDGIRFGECGTSRQSTKNCNTTIWQRSMDNRASLGQFSIVERIRSCIINECRGEILLLRLHLRRQSSSLNWGPEIKE